MAMGNYRIATEAYRPTHASAGTATVGRAQLPEIAGMFGTAFQNMVKAGLKYYEGVNDVGKSLQGLGHKVTGWQADSTFTDMTSIYGS